MVEDQLDDFEQRTARLERLQTACKLLGVETMSRVDILARGNETEYQYGLSLVIRQLLEHMGMSLNARAMREGILEDRHGRG